MAVLAVALKILFSLLSCVMAVTIIYAFTLDHFVSCYDLKARWTQVAMLDACINISFIGVWFFYKESRWILRIVFIFILYWTGSVIICAYLVIQLFKLSPQESAKDVIFFVLVRRQKRDAIGHTGVVTTRRMYVLLGCVMLGALVLVFATDGSPFRAEVLSPCMIPLLTDLCFHVVIFSVWIAYKESTWINALFWILLIICFQSIALCAYVVRESFRLSPEQPAFLILFNKNGRDLMLSDPLLMEHDDV